MGSDSCASPKSSVHVRPWLVQQARKRPEAVALISDEGHFSYARLAESTAHIARCLRSAGVRHGDRVAVLAANCKRFVELVHACGWIGAIVVPLNMRLGRGALTVQLRACRPRILLADSDHEALACAAGQTVPGLRVLSIDDVAELSAGKGSAVPATVSLQAVHSIIYTSGSTAAPKGVMLTNAQHLASARSSAGRLGYRPGDVWLAVLPLCHVGGLSILLRAVLCGLTVVLHRRFAEASVNETLACEHVTFVSLVPTMLVQMLDEQRCPASYASLRCALVGGAAPGAELLQRAKSRGIPLRVTYGLTEAASQVTTTRRGEALRHPGSCGPPLRGTRVKIRDPDGEGYGEILVRGPQVMSGYFGDCSLSRTALRGGWLHTGDIGRLDSGGRLYVEERMSEVIVTGGENVYPTAVEACLKKHPAVCDAAVFGLPDRVWGARVSALVVLRAQQDFNLEALRAWCLERLAPFEVPRTIEAAAYLPRTASGKLRREALTERYRKRKCSP